MRKYRRPLLLKIVKLRDLFRSKCQQTKKHKQIKGQKIDLSFCILLYGFNGKNLCNLQQVGIKLARG